MRRRLVISDIHGCYDEFMELLHVVNYRPGLDRLILLGDFVDRGPQSKEVVEQVWTMVDRDGVIALQGNHDERFVDVVRGQNGEAEAKFFLKGGRETTASYIGEAAAAPEMLHTFRETIRDRYPHHLAFLESLPYYWEDEAYIYVHAGLNPAYADWRQQPKRDFLYIKDAFHQHPVRAGKTVVFGHTRALELHNRPDIWFRDGKIGIDGGCAYGYQLNCLEITDDRQFRTYAVQARKR